jgi:hypothetical protein
MTSRPPAPAAQFLVKTGPQPRLLLIDGRPLAADAIVDALLASDHQVVLASDDEPTLGWPPSAIRAQSTGSPPSDICAPGWTTNNSEPSSEPD